MSEPRAMVVSNSRISPDRQPDLRGSESMEKVLYLIVKTTLHLSMVS